MGQILEPIFENESPLRVALLSLCLVLISVLEVYFSRVGHRHRFMFISILGSISISVFLVGYLGNAFAIQAKPWYKSTQFIPVLGMLIGNCMSAVAVGLNTVMAEIMNNKEAIEMHLAFGASRWETARPICVRGIKLALLPILNSQSIMGLISIPGMMTGQILGGVPVKDAVNYQLIVTFMYTATAGLATVFTALGAVYSVFDGQARLRLDRVSKRPKFTIASLKIGNWWKRDSMTERQPLIAHSPCS